MTWSLLGYWELQIGQENCRAVPEKALLGLVMGGWPGASVEGMTIPLQASRAASIFLVRAERVSGWADGGLVGCCCVFG